MPYAYTQDVPIGEDVYRRIAEKLGPSPLAGLISHVVVKKPDGKLRYIDVWDSKEACARAFEERIHPAVFAVFQELGYKPDGEPAVDVANIVEVRIGAR